MLCDLQEIFEKILHFVEYCVSVGVMRISAHRESIHVTP